MRSRYVRNFMIFAFLAIMLFPLICTVVYAFGNMGATDGIPRPAVGSATVDAYYNITATPDTLVGDFVELLRPADSSVGKPVFRYSYDFLHDVLGTSSTVSVLLAICIVYQLTILAIIVIIGVFSFPIMILSER